MEQINFLLVGVGGQGVLTASDILANVGLQAGYDVKKSEVHGMAQRGGTVISHIRFGDTVYAPLVGQGEASYLLAFEMLEALRWITFLHPQGVVLVNQQSLPPVAVTSGGATYPDLETVRQELADRAGQVLFVQGLGIAQELGNVRVTNTVLLGALSAFLPIGPSLWETVIAERVPPRFIGLNRQAFQLGREQVEIA